MAKKTEESPVFTMEDGTTIQHTNGLKFQCPTCGLDVVAGEEACGRQSVVHKQPMCNMFEQMDPLDYLTYVRKYHERLN